MLKNVFKKHPLQNRTNVQIKGGGVKGLLNNVKKNCTFLTGRLPLERMTKISPLLHLSHKFLQLCSLVLDSFGEVLSDVNVASGQKLGLPKDWHCVS